MRRKFILFFLIAPVWLLFFNFAHAANDHLWINQIQVEGDGGTGDEFIELYNPTDQTINLNGWSIQYKSSSSNFPLSNSSQKKNLPTIDVPAHAYFLIATSSYNGAVAADHVQSSIALTGTSTGATVFLVHSTSYLSSGSDSTIVDKLAYGSSANNSPETASATTPPSEKSLSRSGSDTDNNSTDFSAVNSTPHNLASSAVVSPTPSPSPAPAPAPTPPPADPTPTPPPPAPEPTLEPSPSPTPQAPLYSSDIIISEILPNPDGPDNGEEWIELYNDSDLEVDLSGWLVDDSGDVLGKDAYIIPEGTKISGRSYWPVNLPAEVFALNNTGGDAVRLFWPNQNLAVLLAYTDNAKEDEAYARTTYRNYQWTSFVTKGAVNQFSSGVVEGIISNAQTRIKINEIFPNPKGPDSGGEWVEVINFGTEPVYLHNWYLDDGEVQSKLGASAYQIQSPIVNPGNLAVISIPSGKFSMNNSAQETIRLFNDNKVLIDSVVYEKAEEESSYALVNGKWVWTHPSPNAVNTQATEAPKETSLAQIVINEIYPEPLRASQQEEFIELFNAGDFSVDLTDFKLSDSASSFKFKEGTIAPGKFLVILKSESKISLNNSGKETVTLENSSGEVIASLEYEDAPKDQSYNLTVDGSYQWSTQLTPDQANEILAVKFANPKPIIAVDNSGSEALAIEEDLPAEEIPAIVIAEAATGQVSGASIVAPVNSISNTNLAYWLAGSFAVNLLFCYSLTRLMLRKTRSE